MNRYTDNIIRNTVPYKAMRHYPVGSTIPCLCTVDVACQQAFTSHATAKNGCRVIVSSQCCRFGLSAFWSR